ncbi:hypothetical protein KPATCC21470_0172 [Kitasatospora purpeofusca]
MEERGRASCRRRGPRHRQEGGTEPPARAEHEGGVGCEW